MTVIAVAVSLAFMGVRASVRMSMRQLAVAV